MGSSISRIVATRHPAGALVEAIGTEQVDELQEILDASGLTDLRLESRYSVVFVYPGLGVGERYPELAGCTAEVCTFAEEATEFQKHGIQLAGLSTQPTEPVGDVDSFPFPIGRLGEDIASTLIAVVAREDDVFATRRSFVVFPDGTGVCIAGIEDPVGHVRHCFDVAIDRRLAEYREAAISSFRRLGACVRTSWSVG